MRKRVFPFIVGMFDGGGGGEKANVVGSKVSLARNGKTRSDTHDPAKEDRQWRKKNSGKGICWSLAPPARACLSEKGKS
jgi:hypothetical protein